MTFLSTLLRRSTRSTSAPVKTSTEKADIEVCYITGKYSQETMQNIIKSLGDSPLKMDRSNSTSPQTTCSLSSKFSTDSEDEVVSLDDETVLISDKKLSEIKQRLKNNRLFDSSKPNLSPKPTVMKHEEDSISLKRAEFLKKEHLSAKNISPVKTDSNEEIIQIRQALEKNSQFNLSVPTLSNAQTTTPTSKEHISLKRSPPLSQKELRTIKEKFVTIDKDEDIEGIKQRLEKSKQFNMTMPNLKPDQTTMPIKEGHISLQRSQALTTKELHAIKENAPKTYSNAEIAQIRQSLSVNKFFSMKPVESETISEKMIAHTIKISISTR